MKFRVKSTSILFVALVAFVGANTEEAAAQSKLIKRLRSFNKGKPILPFVNDGQQPVRVAGGRAPTPAKKLPDLKKGSGTRGPTLANKKSNTAGSASKGTAAKTDQRLSAKGFGMKIQQSGERFYVSEVASRGNAAAAGLRRGDLIVNVGGAPLKVVEEIESIAKAMRSGDRVEFEVSRRGSKAEKVFVQFGQAPKVEQPKDEPQREVAPATPRTVVKERPRYVPEAGGLRSVYDGAETPSSVFEPTPAPRGSNRVESLGGSLDLPALELDN